MQSLYQGFTLFSQTFAYHDLFVVLLLVLLEGVLSIDNALVLGILARRLPEKQRDKALSYGLIGAVIFRILAIFMASLLLKSKWLQIIGGLYLLYLPLKHFLTPSSEEHESDDPSASASAEPTPGSATGERSAMNDTIDGTVNDAIESTDSPVATSQLNPVGTVSQKSNPPKRDGKTKVYAKFWPTVFVIELTDIAFAIDSILAAVAMVVTEHGSTEGKISPKIHPKMWIIVSGGLIGVVLVRFAAKAFIKLLDKFPRFETSAYLLVLVVGLKLMIDAVFNEPGKPHQIDFSSPKSAAFWAMWASMALCFAIGFIPRKAKMQAENFVD